MVLDVGKVCRTRPTNSSDRGIAFSFKPVQSNLTPECLIVNNPFRAAQNPQATAPQHDPAIADAVAVAVAEDASLSLRVPVKMRPHPKHKILQRPQTHLLKPRLTLQHPLLRMSAQLSHQQNPRLSSGKINVHLVLNAPRAKRNPARPSRHAVHLSNGLSWSNAFNV